MKPSRHCCRPRLTGFGWTLPAAALLLVPKCPACLAGWIAVLTGATVPLAAAEGLRAGLAAACVAAVLWLLVRRFRLRYPITNRP